MSFSSGFLRKWTHQARALFELCSPIPISSWYTAYPLNLHRRLKMIIYIVSIFVNNALERSLLTQIIHKYCYRMRRVAWNHYQKHRCRVFLIVMDCLCIVYSRHNECKNTDLQQFEGSVCIPLPESLVRQPSGSWLNPSLSIWLHHRNNASTIVFDIIKRDTSLSSYSSEPCSYYTPCFSS